MKRNDLVTIANFPYILGKVKRVARDGSWVDVHWTQDSTGVSWAKRQRSVALLRLVDEPPDSWPD